MILETTFVIDFIRGREKAVNKMRELLEQNISFGIASPTIFELYGGLIQLGKGEKEQLKIGSFLKSLTIYPLDDESAKIAGIIDGKLVKSGLEIDTEDSMIAGIAIFNNQKLLTRNGHFRRIESLKVEEY